MESGGIKDAQVTASSEWDRNHAAIQGRLNFKAGGGKQGGWSAGKNNGNQWIQVALGSYTKLTSIATQGRNAHSQWVTAYKLQYSEDGVNFYYYKVPGQSSPKVNVEAVTWFKTVKNISLCLHSIDSCYIICCKYFIVKSSANTKDLSP